MKPMIDLVPLQMRTSPTRMGALAQYTEHAEFFVCALVTNLPSKIALGRLVELALCAFTIDRASRDSLKSRKPSKK